MLQHALPIALMIAMIMTRQGLPDKTRSPQQTDALKVSITSGKETYRIAEPIDLRVTLENGGKMTIFVGQTIRRMDWICSIRIRVSDESGRPSPELHWNHPFMSDYDSSQTFVDALTRNWISLPPGYTYGTTLQLNGNDFEFLGKPGRYQIEATYTSYGMEEPLNYNRLAASPNEIQKLPYVSWRGETKSKPIWISIVPTKP